MAAREYIIGSKQIHTSSWESYSLQPRDEEDRDLTPHAQNPFE